MGAGCSGKLELLPTPISTLTGKVIKMKTKHYMWVLYHHYPSQDHRIGSMVHVLLLDMSANRKARSISVAPLLSNSRKSVVMQ
jgi:hypothetical protein